MAVIDTRLTEDLMMEGLAREVVRRVQSMRRDADFNISDNIALRYRGGERLTRAIRQFGEYIQNETLAVTVEEGEPDNGFFRADFVPHDDPKQDTSINGEPLSLGVKRSTG
jgi:isoleucyl-tRNA synthetase